MITETINIRLDTVLSEPYCLYRPQFRLRFCSQLYFFSLSVLTAKFAPHCTTSHRTTRRIRREYSQERNYCHTISHLVAFFALIPINRDRVNFHDRNQLTNMPPQKINIRPRTRIGIELQKQISRSASLSS
jgi:hypothetical protein